MESPRNLMRAKFEHDDSNPSGDPDLSADGDSYSKEEEQNLENVPVEVESCRSPKRAKIEHNDSNPSGDPDLSADGDSSSKQEEQNLENMPVEYYPTEVEIDKVAMTRYYKQLRESDGFDVDPLPRPTLLGPRICGGHVPITPPIPVRIRKILQDCSEEAIKFYNERENTNYKYDDLVKANVRGAAVAMYFITFQATDPSDQSSVIFQAQVWRTVELKYEVILCRIKPTQ